MALIYEFWTHDIPTEIVKQMLEELEIPYDERVLKRRRKSLLEEPYDEWSKIYVDAKELVRWLKKKIENELDSYGN